MYREYAIFEKNNRYLLFFPRINFWLKTNRKGLCVFKNILQNKVGDAELRMKKIIETGAQFIEYAQSMNIDLLEIEFSIRLTEEIITAFIQNNLEVLNENVIKGLVLKKLMLLPELAKSKFLELGFNYIEIDCNSEKLEENLFYNDVFKNIRTLHLKNIILDVSIIEQIRKLKQIMGTEIVIHVKNKTFLHDYIKICACNDWYFAIDLGSFETSYYELYTDLMNYVQSLDWNIDYKKYCAMFNYEKIIENRLVRKSCGLARDKIYICEDGNIYSCQDCAQRKCFAIGTIFDKDFSKKWKEGRLCEKVRELTVDSMKECRKCCFRYICGGQCRMKSFDKYKSFDNRSAYCDDERKIYVDLLWKSIEKQEDK